MKLSSYPVLSILSVILGIVGILLAVAPHEALKNLGSWTNVLLPLIVIILSLFVFYLARQNRLIVQKFPIKHKLLRYNTTELRDDIKQYLSEVETIRIIAYSSETLSNFITWEDLRKYKLDIQILVRNEIEEQLEQACYNLDVHTEAWKKLIIPSILAHETEPMKGRITFRFYSGPPTHKAVIVTCRGGRKIAYFGVYRWISESHEVTQEGSQYVGADCVLLKVEENGAMEKEIINQVESRFHCYWQKHSISLSEMKTLETRRPKNLKAVLLDFDGVVANSMPIYEKAWIKGASSVGICIDHIIVYLREGELPAETARYILRAAGKDPDDESLVNSILQAKENYLNDNYRPGFVDGMEDCIKAFRKAGLKVLLVTSTRGARRKAFIKTMCSELFDDIIFGDELTDGKPAAAPYLFALQKAQESSFNCVAIENSPFGVRSAVAARIPCIGFNVLRKIDDELLIGEGCIAVKRTARLLESYILDRHYLVDYLRKMIATTLNSPAGVGLRDGL